MLGQFDLVGIAPGPRGQPQIEVTFDIDANGIVHVSTKDLGTGKEQQIRIQASGGLSKADIERMVKEAEAHREEDKQRRELVEAKNNAEAQVAAAERAINEAGANAPTTEKMAVESAIANVKSALSSDSPASIRSRTEELAQAMGRFAQASSQSGAPAGGQAQGESGGAREAGAGAQNAEDVVDAEFEEVNDSGANARR